MWAHGNFKIELKGNVIHVYPVGGFNKEGIDEVHTEVSIVAPNNTAWILFEHPKDLAGLTPEALDALVESYLKFQEQNCSAIALEICSTWEGVVRRALKDKLYIPLFLSDDLTYLENQIGKMPLANVD